MIELEKIKELAREAYFGGCSAVPAFIFWDSALRLARNVQIVSNVPELAGAGFQIDKFCLLSATYFFYAGEVKYLAARAVEHPIESYVSVRDMENAGELGAEVVEEMFKGLVDDTRIQKTGDIIVESRGHFSKLVEAMILSDARNLDDMGVIGIYNELKKYAGQDKPIDDIIAAWQRKKDYGYWDARLKEDFRFESVRKIAEERLSKAEYLINELASEHNSKDLFRVVTESLVSQG